jgi:hypothetical protein
VDVRKHLDDKSSFVGTFDLAFEAIDELYCHANTNDLVKATSEVQKIKMRPSETSIDLKMLYGTMLHGRDKVTTGLWTKFIYPPRAFVEDNCCVEDKNKECMRLYSKVILTDSLKESYLENAICDISEYKFALMIASHNGYKELRSECRSQSEAQIFRDEKSVPI